MDTFPSYIESKILHSKDELLEEFSKFKRVSISIKCEAVRKKSHHTSYFLHLKKNISKTFEQQKTHDGDDAIRNQKMEFKDQVKTVVSKEIIDAIDKLEKYATKNQFAVLSDNMRKNIWSMISTLKLELESSIDEMQPQATTPASFLNTKKQLQEILDAIWKFLDSAEKVTECSTKNDILRIFQLCKHIIMTLKDLQIHIDMTNIEMVIMQIFTKIASVDWMKKMTDIKDKVKTNYKSHVSIDLWSPRNIVNNSEDGLLDNNAVGQKIASRHECRLIMYSHHYRFFNRTRRKPSVASCVFLLTALFILEVAISSASSDRRVVEITAVVVQENGELHLKLECVSLYQPFACSVEILANGKTVDEIRYVDEDCYHQKGRCGDEICICSDCTNFTWFSKLFSIPTNTTYSCRMSFDEDTMHNYKYYESSLIYNGTDFTILSNTGFTLPTDEQVTNTTKNNDTTEIISHTLVYVMVGLSIIVVVLLLIGPFVLYRRNNKNKRTKGSLGTKYETTSISSEGSDKQFLRSSSERNIEP